MKTTIDIPDALLEAARVAARERGTTLRDVVTAGLRAQLAAMAQPAHAAPFSMPIFEGDPGLQPGVELADWDAVRSLAYGRWA